MRKNAENVYVSRWVDLISGFMLALPDLFKQQKSRIDLKY